MKVDNSGEKGVSLGNKNKISYPTSLLRDSSRFMANPIYALVFPSLEM